MLINMEIVNLHHGTTAFGGAYGVGNRFGNGYGTVFEIVNNGTSTAPLHHLSQLLRKLR